VSAESRRTGEKARENLDAWECVVRGNASLWQGGKEDVASARNYFERATHLDPRNATALGGIAMSQIRDVVFNWADDPSGARESALEAARMAVSADVENAWAHAAASWVFSAVRENDSAFQAARTALQLNPNLAFAEGVLGLIHAHRGEATNAVEHVDKADRLSPRDPARPMWTLSRSWAAFIERNYVAAVEWARWITRASPSFPGGWRHLATSCAHLDRLAEAQEAIDQLLQLSPNDNLEHARRVVPTDQPELLDRYIDGLRKAGLPE
jgi:tetratricopeptide (TPR) repeat protein